MKQTILILAFSFFSITAHGVEFCKKVKSQGEGHWPVDESAFTLERANKAASELQKLINANTTNNKEAPYPEELGEMRNHFMMIKGYMLKTMLVRSIRSKDDKKTDKVTREMMEKSSTYLKKDFCDFIENDAYVSH